jgi:hypothetical protein
LHRRQPAPEGQSAAVRPHRPASTPSSLPSGATCTRTPSSASRRSTRPRACRGAAPVRCRRDPHRHRQDRRRRRDPRQATDSGRMIGLRADMDALTMTENNEFAWKSAKAGMMHGCGHDGHTAMLVGAARYLAETRNFDGTAVLIFQPGEEGFAGAKAMIEDGLFQRFPVESVYRHAQLARAQARDDRHQSGPDDGGGRQASPSRSRARAATAPIPTSRSIRCWSRRTSSPPCRASSRATCGPSTAQSSACARCRPATCMR